MLCTTCQIPMVFPELDDLALTCYRSSEYEGDTYHFCSDGCKDIFDNEPEKYVQSWLPVHQIYQGNCGGATVEDVVKWYHMEDGVDNREYLHSPDRRNWDKWTKKATDEEVPPKTAVG